MHIAENYQRISDVEYDAVIVKNFFKLLRLNQPLYTNTKKNDIKDDRGEKMRESESETGNPILVLAVANVSTFSLTSTVRERMASDKVMKARKYLFRAANISSKGKLISKQSRGMRRPFSLEYYIFILTRN